MSGISGTFKVPSLIQDEKIRFALNFASQCQNGDAAFISQFLWYKYSCKFDKKLKTNIHYLRIVFFGAMIGK